MSFKVACISSHVAVGAVGNAAIAAGLQALGVNAVILPSIVLSNHPGLGPPVRQEVDAGFIEASLNKLEANGWLDDCNAILTGYFADAAQIEAAAEVIARLKARHSGLIYICDPVIGDHPKGLYVPQPVARAIRDHLIPLSDVSMPNQFEFDWLRQDAGADQRSPLAADWSLRKTIWLVTSFQRAGERTMATALFDQGRASCVTTAYRPGVPHGTGDLLSGLFAANYLRDGDHHAALALSVAQLEQVIEVSPPEILDLATGLQKARSATALPLENIA